MVFKRALGSIIVVVSGLIAFSSSSAQSDPTPSHYDRALPSLVRVVARNRDGSWEYGTGWVIEAANSERNAGAAIIATALHTVQNASSIVVIASGDEVDDRKPASIRYRAVDRDVAFLEVKDLSSPALELDQSKQSIGESIGVAGYTGAEDRDEYAGIAKTPSFKFGGLSKQYRGKVTTTEVNAIEFDAQILIGYSGGPVLNSEGCVIGMALYDGGHAQLASDVTVQFAPGVSSGVAASELIAAANATNVEIKHCKPQSSPSPTPTSTALTDNGNLKDCARLNTDVDELGKRCRPISNSSWNISNIRWEYLALGVLVLALIGLAVSIFAIVRSRSGSRIARQTAGSGGNSPLSPPNGPPTQGSKGTTQVSSNVVVGAPLTGTIRLTGRGPNGEPIDYRFAREQLSGHGKTLGAESEIIIPDKRDQRLVSRSHAHLGFDGSNFFVADNRSSNGTFLNELRLKPMERHVLSQGDKLRFADVTLNVSAN